MTPGILLVEMSRELGIVRSRIESENEWIQRIVLSACSAWVLESIRSVAVSLSVTQIKRRLKDKVFAYVELFQMSLDALKTEDSINSIVDYIFDIHLKGGSIYHKAYYICPAKEQVDTCFGIKLYRSPAYPLKLLFSGIGTYIANEEIEKNRYQERLFSHYLLPREQPKEILKQLIKNRRWHAEIVSPFTEFLNVFRKHSDGYYTKKSFDSNDITLLREAVEHGYRYILRLKGMQYDIQEWEQQEYIHEYIALALMEKHQDLYARVLIDDDLIKIKLDYSLPTPEENFLRLYAWPHSFSDLYNHWNFGMMPAIYPLIKKRLSHLGLIIREEIA